MFQYECYWADPTHTSIYPKVLTSYNAKVDISTTLFVPFSPSLSLQPIFPLLTATVHSIQCIVDTYSSMFQIYFTCFSQLCCRNLDLPLRFSAFIHFSSPCYLLLIHLPNLLQISQNMIQIRTAIPT